MKPILNFRGDYRFLSNFFPSPTLPPTLEHHYQAAKCNNLTDAAKILKCTRPGNAKAIGQSVEIRHDWDKVKNQVMYELLLKKFSEELTTTRPTQFTNPLTQRLLLTGDAEIIEGNDWGDTYWGVFMDRGENWLGRLLMQIRGERREYLAARIQPPPPTIHTVGNMSYPNGPRGLGSDFNYED